MTSFLRLANSHAWDHVVGIGGIGTGVVFRLEGSQTLGREESREATLLPGRDFCKLHIVEDHMAALMGAKAPAADFRVTAIGVVGDDPPGRDLLSVMNSAGIDTGGVRIQAGLPTLFSACFLYPDGSGGNVTANNSAAAALNAADLERAAAIMQPLGNRCVALCLPEVPLDARLKFLELATQFGNFRVASFTPAEIVEARRLNLLPLVDLLALNWEEARSLAGSGVDDPDRPENDDQLLEACSSALMQANPAMRIIASAGARGAYGFTDGEWRFCPAPKVEAISTGGAGDALLAGVVCGMAAGLPFTVAAGGETGADNRTTDSALQLGVLLAGMSVTSPDAIHFGAGVESLRAFADAVGMSFSRHLSDSIISYEEPPPALL
jgi:sugar/nucleoside kinase (ribokinase family)